MKLSDLAVGSQATIVQVRGQGSFRRRLMELGLLPGTRVELVSVAPLGDPMELLVRGASLSIRRGDAEIVQVTATQQEAVQLATNTRSSRPPVSDCARGAS